MACSLDGRLVWVAVVVAHKLESHNRLSLVVWGTNDEKLVGCAFGVFP
jgi:hypothetical protein